VDDRYNRACIVRFTSGANVAGQQSVASGRVGGHRRRWQGSSTAWLHGRWHCLERGFGGDGGLDLTRASPALSNDCQPARSRAGCARRVMTAVHAAQFWQRQTNVWRKVTSPGPTAKASTMNFVPPDICLQDYQKRRSAFLKRLIASTPNVSLRAKEFRRWIDENSPCSDND
jgi:hypothetical protein